MNISKKLLGIIVLMVCFSLFSFAYNFAIKTNVDLNMDETMDTITLTLSKDRN